MCTYCNTANSVNAKPVRLSDAERGRQQFSWNGIPNRNTSNIFILSNFLIVTIIIIPSETFICHLNLSKFDLSESL